LIVFLLPFAAAYSQTTTIPTWFQDSFKRKGLDKKYTISTFLQPSFLQADFNSDATQDIAVTVTEKTTNRKGILLIHNRTDAHFLFGAGISFGSGGNDFTWADKWMLYQKKTAQETRFDKTSGDITGSKTRQLAHPGILIENHEDGAPLAGGIIYWNGKTYSWIHQGE
jgi:hypothetical protein